MPVRHKSWSAAVAALLALAPEAPGATVDFGSTSLVERVVVRDAHASLYGAPGYTENYSGCCINPATGELVVVLRGNGNYALHVYTPDGTFRRRVILTGFSDLEAVCVVNAASNLFAVADEGVNTITLLTVSPRTTTLDRSAGQTLAMGLGYLGNAGIEGLTWDASNTCFYAVKEKAPMAVYRVAVGPTNVVTTPLFDAPAILGALCTDLSDVTFDPVSGHLLILSDESSVVVECGLDGTVYGVLPAGYGMAQPEGVALSADRTELHVIGEPNTHVRYAAHFRTAVEGGTIQVPVTLRQPDPATTVRVDVAVSGVEATPGADFSLPSGSVVIPPGATTGVAVVALAGDAVLEPLETFTIAITNVVGAALGADATAVVGIRDDGRFGVSLEGGCGVGAPIRATLQAVNAVGAPLAGAAVVELGVFTEGVTTNTLVGGYPLAWAPGNAATRGLRIQPAGDITVTHLAYVGGSNVCVWTDAGVLLTNVAGGVQSGGWWQAALQPPLALASGQTYRVATYLAANQCIVNRPVLPLTTGLVTVVSGCFTTGPAFPAGMNYLPYAVDIRYRGAARLPVKAQPPLALLGGDGAWAGWLTVTQALDGARLAARDAAGHAGVSDPFAVAVLSPLTVQLPPSLREGSGLDAATGVVSFATLPQHAEPQTLSLYSSDTNVVQVPSQITAVAGDSNAVFAITAPDTAVAEGTRVVTVHVTATNRATGSGTLRVLDDELPMGLWLRVR